MSSLDCKRGLECRDYECELRHLDVLEREILQVNNKKQQQQKLIVTASRDMGRTASTWVFNAVRLLCRQAHVQCDSYWIRCLSADKLRERMQAAAHVVLIKTHEWTDYLTQAQFDQLIPMFTHVIVSVREGFQPDPAWMNVATHVVHYEDIVDSARVLSVLGGLAQHLDIALNGHELRQVDHQLMALPIPGDQSSKFWSFHARRGGRSQPTTQPASALATRNVFITRHGDRIDNGSDNDWLQKAAHKRRRDAHLSPLGYQEAEELASELVRRCQDDHVRLDHVVSSPFVRCIETADAVAKVFDLEIKIEPGIAEVGSTASQMATQQELQAQFTRIDSNYSPVMSREELPKSELGDGAAARRADKVARTVQSRLGGSILFVGHGASCLGLVRAFGAPQTYVGYCSLTHFQSSDESSSHWRLIGTVGDVSHLSDPQTSLDSAW